MSLSRRILRVEAWIDTRFKGLATRVMLALMGPLWSEAGRSRPFLPADGTRCHTMLHLERATAQGARVGVPDLEVQLEEDFL